MIQTILITALSSQLIYLKPTISSQPQIPFTRVLPRENSVQPVVQKTTKSVDIKFPELQKVIGYSAQLLEPIAGASASPTVIYPSITIVDTAMPTTTPTPQPTAVPTIVAPSDIQAQAPVGPANTAFSISDESLTYLGNCEAGMNPTRNSGNGYYGAFQFSYGTWKSMNTGYERADLAPLEVQKTAVRQLLQRSSIYNQFPGCARKMRSSGLI